MMGHDITQVLRELNRHYRVAMAHLGFENASQGQWARRASLHELSGSLGLTKTHITQDKFHHKSPTLKCRPFLWWFRLSPSFQWRRSDKVVPSCPAQSLSRNHCRWNVSNIAQPRTTFNNIDDFPSNKPTFVWGTSQHVSLPGVSCIPIIFPWYSNSTTLVGVS